MSATTEVAHFCASSFGDVIRRIWPRHAAKRIARATNSPVPTARRWVSGETEPRASDLVRLMAECVEVQAEINKIVEELRVARQGNEGPRG
jgi:hypothetical protein